MIVFQLVYVGLSIVLFFYCVSGRERMLHGFSLALMVNSVPLFLMPQFIGLEARIGGIPIAYLPIMAAAAPFFIRWRTIPKKFLPFLSAGLLYILYITATSFFPVFRFGTLPYYLAWVFNFLLFTAVASFFYRLDRDIFHRVIEKFFYLLIFACLLGMLRVLIGIADDANFMPMMNRNGTVVFIVISAPLLYYLRDIGRISPRRFWLLFFIILSTVVLIKSRAGMICFLFSFLFMHARLNMKTLKYLFLAGILAAGAFLFGAVDVSVDKLQSAGTTVSKFFGDADFDSTDADYQRYMLVQSALAIISDHFVFGAGVGVPNYQAAFSGSVDFFDRDSKAHNFYLSYFAELGLVGFVLLLLCFSFVYRFVSVNNVEFRSFRAIFLSVMLVMAMSEYILLPELWFFFGMLSGVAMKYKRDERMGYE